MGAHPLAPGGDGGGELLLAELGHRGHVLRPVDQHLVRALGRPRGEEVRFAGAFGGEEWIATAGKRPGFGTLFWIVFRPLSAERGVKVGDDAGLPAGRVRRAAAGPLRVELRGGAVLAALAEGTVVRALRLGRAGREAVGAGSAAGGEDRPQPGQLVDADLRRAQEREGGRSPTSGSSAGGGSGCGGAAAEGRGRSVPSARPAAPLPTNGSSTSIGSGKTTVVFWLLPISSSVCR